MIPAAPELVILVTSFLFNVCEPFSNVMPSAPVFLIFVTPLLFVSLPVEATKIPEPVLSNNNSPFWLVMLPVTFIAPFVLTSFVFPIPLIEVPETLIPLEPLLLIVISPAEKFFIVPAISVPPSAPYDVIEMLPWLFLKAFAVSKLSVFTSEVNNASAIAFEVKPFESAASFLTPDIINALFPASTFAASILTKSLATTRPSIFTVALPCPNCSFHFAVKDGNATFLLYAS